MIDNNDISESFILVSNHTVYLNLEIIKAGHNNIEHYNGLISATPHKRNVTRNENVDQSYETLNSAQLNKS